MRRGFPGTPQIQEFGVKVRRVFEALPIRNLTLKVREGSQGSPNFRDLGSKGKKRGPQEPPIQ